MIFSSYRNSSILPIDGRYLGIFGLVFVFGPIVLKNVAHMLPIFSETKKEVQMQKQG